MDHSWSPPKIVVTPITRYRFLHATSTARMVPTALSWTITTVGVTPRVLHSVEARVYYDLAPHGHIPARDLSLT